MRWAAAVLAVGVAWATTTMPADASGAETWMTQGVFHYRSGALVEAERAFSRAAAAAPCGAVRRWNGIPPYAETQWYVWAVLWVFDGLRA